jgi:putative RNA 2'-phosphotransferase
VDAVRTSKLLSYVLRHDPGRIGISLDRAGWVPVTELLDGLRRHGHRLSREELVAVVETSDKQRFAIDAETDRIRANQGHSVDVDLGLAAATPPDVLFHGTPARNADVVEAQGLTRQGRHAVHLSPDRETAARVGGRRGKPVVYAVDAAAMVRDGHEFTVSANGVWLTELVPAAYLRREP